MASKEVPKPRKVDDAPAAASREGGTRPVVSRQVMNNQGLVALFRLARGEGGNPSPAPLTQPKVQTKLTINRPGDEYEQEADRVAAHVMRMATTDASPHVQRKCAACEDEEEKVRRSSSTDSPGAAPPVVHQVLREPGQPLDAATRAFMEPRFDVDFSQVRVHTGSEAAKSADAVNAIAYTVNRDIVFAEGQYSPNSEAGSKLLAHELTHVIQQHAAHVLPVLSGDHQPTTPAAVVLQRQEDSPMTYLQRTSGGPVSPRGTISTNPAPGSFNPVLDPKHPEHFLEELEKLADQQRVFAEKLAEDMKNPQVRQSMLRKAEKALKGHEEKLLNAMRQIEKAEARKLISKSIARAARRIAKKAIPLALVAMVFLTDESYAHDPEAQNVPTEKSVLDHVFDFLDAIDPFYIPPAY